MLLLEPTNNHYKPKEIGIDEKGKYELYSIYEETPCRCHPETCSHWDGMTLNLLEWKKYENGDIVYV